jgi:hypothetical protein
MYYLAITYIVVLSFLARTPLQKAAYIECTGQIVVAPFEKGSEDIVRPHSFAAWKKLDERLSVTNPAEAIEAQTAEIDGRSATRAGLRHEIPAFAKAPFQNIQRHRADKRTNRVDRSTQPAESTRSPN